MLVVLLVTTRVHATIVGVITAAAMPLPVSASGYIYMSVSGGPTTGVSWKNLWRAVHGVWVSGDVVTVATFQVALCLITHPSWTLNASSSIDLLRT